MSVSITLGNSSLEITADPSASNSNELIPRTAICGVFPIKFQQRQVGDVEWTYSHNIITKVRIYINDGNQLDIELQDVSNQSTWSGGTLAGQQQCIDDINNWLASAIIPPPPVAVFSQNGVITLNSLSGLTYQKGVGPSSDSITFGLYASGLIPAAGNITITPDANFIANYQLYNPLVPGYTSAAVTVPYVGSANTTVGFKIRLKAGLVENSYMGSLTITAPNTSPFVLVVSGSVTPNFIIATGGTETTDGDYKIHTFNVDDNFVVSHSGFSPNDVVEYLVIGGGGGGGNVNTGVGGGGGGAGGYLTSMGHAVTVQSYPIVIGAGGASNSNGSNSSFDAIVALGGGSGGEYPVKNGGNGGSGGGGTWDGTAGTGSQGHNGGLGNLGGNAGGGGGGAGLAGGNADVPSSNDGGAGGNGLQSSISGVNTYYGGGGGGGNINNSSSNNGGLGGGGNGGNYYLNLTPINGTPNTGGGGGGMYGGVSPASGALGGSGIVIIRYKFQ